MIKSIKTWIENHPFKSIVVSILVCTLTSSFETIVKEPFAQYRVVYKNTAVYKAKGWSRGCGDDMEGWHYYVQIKDEGWFNSFEDIGKCNEDKSKAISLAESELKRRLKAKKSEEEVYQAYITKGDIVKFEEIGYE